MWVDLEALGTPSRVNSEFLRSLREENLKTLEGEYEENFTLEVLDINERVCYINHESDSNWMWMYDNFILNLVSRFHLCTSNLRFSSGL